MSNVKVEFIGVEYQGNTKEQSVGTANIKFKISGGLAQSGIDIVIKQEVRRDLHLAIHEAQKTLQQFLLEVHQSGQKLLLFPVK